MFAVKVPPCFGSHCHIKFLLTYKQMFSCLHDLAEMKFTTSRCCASGDSNAHVSGPYCMLTRSLLLSHLLHHTIILVCFPTSLSHVLTTSAQCLSWPIGP